MNFRFILAKLAAVVFRRPECQQRFTAACQKTVFVFVFLQGKRLSDMDFTQKRYRQDFAFGQYAADVVYPNRNKFGIGFAFCQMINAGLERQQEGVVVSVTRAFRENNQGVACVQRVFHLFGNRLRIIAMARNQQGIENVLNDEAFEFARQPVIRTGDRARGQTPAAGQGNPHHWRNKLFGAD